MKAMSRQAGRQAAYLILIDSECRLYLTNFELDKRVSIKGYDKIVQFDKEAISLIDCSMNTF